MGALVGLQGKWGPNTTFLSKGHQQVNKQSLRHRNKTYCHQNRNLIGC